MSNTVVYVGPYSFPNGGAAARRILGVCLSIRDAGFDVLVATGQMESEYTHKEFKGIPVYSLNERKHESLPKLMKHFMYLKMGSETVSWLDTLPNKPTAVVLYSGYSPYLIRVGNWCKKNNVQIFFDAVEWYEAPSLVSGFISPYYLNISLAMYFLLPKVDGLICISSFLENYYAKKGCEVVRIPPTLDTEEALPVFALNNSVVKISYTGNPGKKDLLEYVIRAISEINAEGFMVELHLAGDCQEVIDKCSGYDLSSVKYHGFLSYENTFSLVKSSDYTVLFRPYQRSSEAGFSTKFVESISLGTPVLGNITSDLAEHLREGVTGFISPSLEYQAIKDTIFKAVSLDLDGRNQMRENCITHAKNNFDYRNYVDVVRSFFS
ncbi:MAG: glycosyltransferase [Bacterioplanes sp.]|nr:glycosyltransferase [Bacterioplanes sp.]